MVLDPGNRARLREAGTVVWLDATPEAEDELQRLAAEGSMLTGLGPELVVNGNVRARRGVTFADVKAGDQVTPENVRSIRPTGGAG